MKILYIADSTSIHTKRWIGYFRDVGHDISIITLGKKRETIPGIRHLVNFNSFYYGSPTFFPVLLKTRKIVSQIHPDILHGHFIHQYGWLAALAGQRPLVLTAWGTDILHLPGSSRSKWGKYLTRYALRKADLLTATSEHLKREMVRLGAEADKVRVVFWGVDTDRFRPNLDTSALRLSLGIEPDHSILLSNRNQSELYNNDVVIAAFSRVIRAFPKTTLILQNSGGHLEPELREQVRALGLDASVRFLPQYPHEALPTLYALADIYISVPSWDAGPVSLKEAMICGEVPIISDLPGPREWVSEGINGKIVPVRNVEKLADAITDLLGDPQRCERFSLANTRLIKEQADHLDQMKKMECLYRRLHETAEGKRA